MNSSQQASERELSSRKPYMKPQLEIYGDLRQITQMVGKNGNDDSGTGQTHNTRT
jgi:hypothetical protein